MDLSQATAEDPAGAQKLWDEMAAERQNEDGPTAAKPLDLDREVVVAEVPKADAPAEGSEGAPAGADAPAAAAPAAAKPDPITELAERFSKIEGQLRNVNGHIGGLTASQRQMQEAIAAARASTPAVKDAPSEQQVAAAMKNPEKWDSLRADFPEFVEGVEGYFEAKLAHLQPQAAPAFDQTAIDKIVETRVAEAAAANRTEMIDSHLDGVIEGDWRKEVNTPEFGKWLAEQPAEVQALGESSRMTDSAKMLRLYGKSKTSNETQVIADNRKAKLDGALTVKTGLRSTKTKAPEDMTEAELWNYEAGLRDKRRERG